MSYIFLCSCIYITNTIRFQEIYIKNSSNTDIKPLQVLPFHSIISLWNYKFIILIVIVQLVRQDHQTALFLILFHLRFGLRLKKINWSVFSAFFNPLHECKCHQQVFCTLHIKDISFYSCHTFGRSFKLLLK